MSRAVATEDRVTSDAYMTDPKLARALVQLLADRCMIGRGAHLLEPSAGEGAFVGPLADVAPDVHLVANDISASKERREAWGTAGAKVAREGTFESMPRPGAGIYDGYDAIVGNPPYSLAEEHVRHALKLLSHGGVVAFLLRVAFLESKTRIPFWSEHRAQEVHVLAERPSFMGGKTDSTAYGLFIWRKGVLTIGTKLDVFSWGGRDLLPRAGRKRASMAPTALPIAEVCFEADRVPTTRVS